MFHARMFSPQNNERNIVIHSALQGSAIGSGIAGVFFTILGVFLFFREKTNSTQSDSTNSQEVHQENIGLAIATLAVGLFAIALAAGFYAGSKCRDKRQRSAVQQVDRELLVVTDDEDDVAQYYYRY